MSTIDVLIVGATGFTGRLVTKYLAAHREKSSFTLGITVRTKAKADALLASLSLAPDDVSVLVLDVADTVLLETAIARSKVVLNAVGPFWLYGTPVITACARLGKNYVDITGEFWWLHSILDQVDALAMQTGAILVPSCGLDSMPSDLVAFLSVRALEKHCETYQRPWSGAGSSVTGADLPLLASGGTLLTMATAASIVPRTVLRQAAAPYSLSPVKKNQSMAGRLIARMRDMSHPWGSFYSLTTGNRAIVQRSWGLFETTRDAPLRASCSWYGPEYTYEEFLLASNPFAALRQVIRVAVGALLFSLSPMRSLIAKYMPPGSGPSDEELKKGHLRMTNVTSLSDDVDTRARTRFEGNGNPGYFLSSIMVAEAALGLLAPRDELGSLAHRGGLLTPATALGDMLPERLRRSGLFHIDSEIISDSSKKMH